jgi:serine phosphatase RsbU (regulator of sigma subunit)
MRSLRFDTKDPAVPHVAGIPDGAARVPSSHDLALAGRVQRGLMPPPPTASGYEFFAHYQPCYSVGGDFYDFVALPGDRLAVILGDVAGKGLPAAIMMAQFTAEARHRVRLAPTIEAAAADLNAQLYEYAMEDVFITLCVGMLDLGSRRFRYCLAGHPSPLIRRASGRIEEPDPDGGGFPLGIVPDARYDPRCLQLAPGDAVVIYSDGVTDGESAHGDRYGAAANSRLRGHLSRAGEGPVAIGKSIISDLREFSAGRDQFDDITLICFGPIS